VRSSGDCRDSTIAFLSFSTTCAGNFAGPIKANQALMSNPLRCGFVGAD
jgi:hypothetical protein